MSMLAERKTKQKWSLNPRGKAWSEDSSKFGQKMLEKMGWSKGKGLGAKENGITEHVKISYKNDAKGMGFKETSDQWTEHDTNFNALLESLSGKSSPTTAAPKISASLEEKSQNSRARVHYRKFTRGKDLSRASEKDLANIFGKKSFSAVASPIAVKKAVEEQENEVAEIHPRNESLYSNGGSMLEYFKKKMPSFNRQDGYVVGSNGVLKKSSAVSDDEEERPAFAGFGFAKKRKSDVGVEEREEVEFTPKKLKLEERKDSPFKKNKKDDSLGLANPAFEPMATKVCVEKHELNPIAEEESFASENIEIKTKKKKKKHVVEAVEEADCSQYEVKRKKKKREEKSEKSPENGISNANFSDSFQETSTNCEYEVKRKKKKKSKKKNNENNCNFDNSTQSNGINNLNFLELDDSTTLVENTSSSNCDYEVKRTKQKKSSKKIDLAVDNPNFDLSSANSNNNQSDYVNDEFEVKRSSSNSSELLSNSVNFEVKRKKKKKSASNMIVQAHTNQNFQLELEDTAAASSSPTLFNSFEVKRKKTPASNPNFNDSLEQPPPPEDENFAFDLMLNVTSTPSIVKTTQPSSASSVKRRKSVRFSNVTQERIIPNNEDMRERNELFDINTFVIENGLKDTRNIDENCEAIAKKLDGFQAEIENDLNEAKAGFIGDVSTPHGENEQLASGSCKLKFKYANFNANNSFWMMKNKEVSHSRSSYKHLIKGDIVLGFNNTNLHQIEGYAANKTV